MPMPAKDSLITSWSATLLATILFLFGAAPPAWALATEHFGNEPVPPGWGFSKEVLALANLKSRVYWYEVNGDPTFFYRGNTEALNEALAKLAAIPGARPEVVLLPGPGKAKSLGGEKEFLCDWKVHAPGGLYAVDARREKGTNVFTKVPTMTIHVTVSGPATPVDAKQVQRWIGELDADAFTVREAATRELEKLANAAGPALRQAWQADPSPEKRRRIDRLLQQLEGIDLDQMRLPKGVVVIETKDLLDRCVQGLKSPSSDVRGHAASSLGGLAQYSDQAVPLLIDVLKKDKHEFVRRCAASSLTRLGQRAKASLPILKQGLNDPDVNVRNAFQLAVKTIEAAKEETVPAEQIKKQQAIQQRISRFRKGQADKR